LSLTTPSLPLRAALFFNDRHYYSQILKFALPIALLQLFFSTLNLTANVMVGQLGDTAVAAVSLAGQIFFLLNLMVFGIGSGAAMFTAQLWGRRDIPNIRRVLGLALALSLVSAAIFLVIAEFFPAAALSIYSKDPQVIAQGSRYLRIFGFSFILFAISATFSLVLRSVGEVRLPVIVTIFSLILNIGLSYALIFGKFGLPPLGIYGAAIAILISRSVECLLMVTVTYVFKLPPAGTLRQLFTFDVPFAKCVLIPVLPILVNELLWSFGITTYQVIYARMGTEQLAAINISMTITDLAMVVFFGLGTATSILVGNLIGSDQDNQAQVYAGRSLALSFLGGLLFGVALWLFSPKILSLYKVSPEVIVYAKSILMVSATFLWVRMMNLVQFLGIFRAGGDTRFALVLDGIIIWVVGVPLTAFGAFVLHLPIYLVYLLTMSEELVKWLFGLWRYFSQKWIHNLANTVETVPS
jgi:MATE family, multidrug efflux pump